MTNLNLISAKWLAKVIGKQVIYVAPSEKEKVKK